MNDNNKYNAIVIGASAGGFEAISKLLSCLSVKYPLPVIIVQHRAKDDNILLEELMQMKCRIKVKQADEKEIINNNMVYFAPANYHLLIEENKTFALSTEPPVNHSRPSIDLLFESAAEVYGKGLIGIILTGSNHDGAEGMRHIKNMGGLTIAQKPETAVFPNMPIAAINNQSIKYIWELDEINNFLSSMND